MAPMFVLRNLTPLLHKSTNLNYLSKSVPNYNKFIQFNSASRLKCVQDKAFLPRHFSSASMKSPAFLTRTTACLAFGSGGFVIGFYALYSTLTCPTIEASEGLTESPAKASRRIGFKNDNSGLKIVLYQYQTCPFCCKVRAFLDYKGISYDIVEVDPVMRQQIKFSKWRKVPILLIKQQENAEYQQLNDSSLIISLLQSHLLNPHQSVEHLSEFYPVITVQNEKGKEQTEILNRYHVMLGPKRLLNENDIQEEQKWREWADNTLVHTLSPNVYRTPGEALQAFNWFSKVGEWEQNFPLWERFMVIYVGAAAMYLIGKRLKKRHKLDDDVRQSLYKACNEWTEAVGTKNHFKGGSSPNLSDLAVYGVLSSIEGCTAFGEVLENTNIGTWFNRMKALTSNNPNKLTTSSS